MKSCVLIKGSRGGFVLGLKEVVTVGEGFAQYSLIVEGVECSEDFGLAEGGCADLGVGFRGIAGCIAIDDYAGELSRWFQEWRSRLRG
jgi:hypothetical protein